MGGREKELVKEYRKDEIKVYVILACMLGIICDKTARDWTN